MDIGAFRTAFPEFADTTVYPTTQITFWATLAEKLVSSCVFGTVYTQAVQLYVAHEITLAAQNQKAAASGGVPGQSGGTANSKTVGSVSVGYDITSISEENGGYWNLTNYGRQLLRLARLFGAGAIQL
jgi:hypothetical protein